MLKKSSNKESRENIKHHNEYQEYTTNPDDYEPVKENALSLPKIASKGSLV